MSWVKAKATVALSDNYNLRNETNDNLLPKANFNSLEVVFLFWAVLIVCLSIPCGSAGKESTCQCRRFRRRKFDPWVWKTPWRRKRQLTPVFFPGKSHGQRSLTGYSPWVPKQADTTGQLSTELQYCAPSRGNYLEKEMATHSSVLAWRIPGTGEPGGLPSMGSHRVGHDWSDLE